MLNTLISHFGYLLGCFSFWLMGAKKKIIQENYKNLGYSSREAFWLTLRSLGNYGRLLTEFARLGFFKNETILNWGIKNESVFKQSLTSGRGIVLATFHFGNWDLAGCSMGVRNYPLAVIADPVGPPWLNERVIRSREAKGMQVIPTRKAPVQIDDILKSGKSVAFLVDRPMEKGGVSVRFAGRTVNIPKGAMHYARKHNTHLLVGYALRKQADVFEPTVGSEIKVIKTDDEAADLKVMGQSIMDEYEKLVRQHPEQWYMFRPFGRN